ncbi:hypothetical protein M9H77_04247 [Catharanthus roseus]|uniref:Uncharacterized protein n=1 Tax=Catharanthus roseus TaxID=4058 RepID=A0ACC0CDR1_CATRO|nr:hypothetical protein M9H77_04247 [Catharanthus roseus]
MEIFQAQITRLMARMIEREDKWMVALFKKNLRDPTWNALEVKNEDQRSTKTFLISIVQERKPKKQEWRTWKVFVQKAQEDPTIDGKVRPTIPARSLFKGKPSQQRLLPTVNRAYRRRVDEYQFNTANYASCVLGVEDNGRNMEKELGNFLEDLPINPSLNPSLMWHEVSFVELELFLESYLSHFVHDDSFFDAKVGGFLEFNCASFVIFHEDFKEKLCGCSQELVFCKEITSFVLSQNWKGSMCHYFLLVSKGKSYGKGSFERKSAMSFLAASECDPYACQNCSISCNDGTLCTPFKKGDMYECMNMMFLSKQEQRVILGSSYLSGCGEIFKNSIAKHEYLGECTSEQMIHREANKHGNIYDYENSSCLFNFNICFLLDLSRQSLSFYFLLELQDIFGNIKSLLEISSFPFFT